MTFSTKIYPQTIWGAKYNGNHERLLEDVSKAGLNSIIVPAFQGSRVFYPTEGEAIPQRWDLRILQKRCTEYDIAFSPEFPVFNDPDTYDRITQYRPVNIYGTTELLADWYKPICPSNDYYREYRVNLILKAINEFSPFVISLDFLHYPYIAGFDEELQKPTDLPRYCYCDFCKYSFQDYSGMASPQHDVESWYQWRSENITIIPVLIAEGVEKRGQQLNMILQIPAAPSGGYVEYVRRLTGLDVSQWRNLIQVISPQLHIYRHGMPVAWAKDIIEELKARCGDEIQIMPEVDLPLISESSNQTELQKLLQMLHAADIGAVTFFHWELLEGSDNARQLINEFANT